MHNIYLTQLVSVSIQNKYLDIYIRLINRAAARAGTKQEAQTLIGYCELHHIIPRSFNLGGESDKDNMVYLTAKEHIIVHRLLCKFVTPPYLKCANRAYHCMCVKTNGGRNKRYPSLHQLAKAREAHALANKGPKGIKGAPSWSKCNTLQEFKSLLQDHLDHNLSDPTIGDLYGVSAATIHIWRRKLNISLRRPLLKDKEWLRHHYIDLCMSTGEIGELVDATGAGVNLWLSKHGIPKRKGRRSNADLLR